MRERLIRETGLCVVAGAEAVAQEIVEARSAEQSAEAAESVVIAEAATVQQQL